MFDFIQIQVGYRLVNTFRPKQRLETARIVGGFPFMNQWVKQRDVLREKYCSEEALNQAKELLQKDEQSEAAFLGAQGVLLLHGLI